MTVKRCEHIVDVNLGLLQKLLSADTGKKFVFENIQTHMTFKLNMTTESKKQLAHWLIKELAKNVADEAHKKGG